MKPRRHPLDFLFVHAEAGLSPIQAGTTPAPLGLVQMATFLNAQGFRCRVVDTRHPHFTPEGFADYLHAFRPRFIGFTVLTDTLFTVGRLVEISRRASPSSRIVLGGAHATVCDEEALGDLGGDVVVRGEGEIAALDLLQRKKVSEARGVTLRQGKKIARTALPPFIDMDLLPTPDIAVVEGWEELPYSPAIVTGRGCPYRCSFCCAGILSRRVRWRSLPRVMEDIAAARRRIPGNLLFIGDDTFTIDPERTAAFCREIQRIGGGSDFFWYCEGRVDRLAKHPDLVRQMREAGLLLLQLGIESGDERVLAAYRKEITLNEVRSLVEVCGRERVFLHAGFIIGGAFESSQTIARSESLLLDLVKGSHGLLQAQFSFCTPLPGTDLGLHPGRFGIRPLDPKLLSSVGFDNGVTETEGLSRIEIMLACQRLMARGIASLGDRIASWNESLRSYAEGIFRRTGMFHTGLLLSVSGDYRSLVKRHLEQIFSRAEAMSLFRLTAGRRWPDLIPIRTPSWEIDEGGRYGSRFLEQRLTALESDVFHYACGKHTGRTIAKFLGKRMSELSPAFASLEKKRMIFYRTF